MEQKDKNDDNDDGNKEGGSLPVSKIHNSTGLTALNGSDQTPWSLFGIFLIGSSLGDGLANTSTAFRCSNPGGIPPPFLIPGETFGLVGDFVGDDDIIVDESTLLGFQLTSDEPAASFGVDVIEPRIF